MRVLLLLVMIAGAVWYINPGDFRGIKQDEPLVDETEVSGEAQDAAKNVPPPAPQKSYFREVPVPKETTKTETSAPVQEESVVEEPVVTTPPPAPPVPEESEVPLTPPIVSFTASSIILEDGDPLTLTWDVKEAKTCKSSGFITYGKMSGTITLRPSTSLTYGLECTSDGGTVSKSVEVAVVPINVIGVTLQSSLTNITSVDSVALTWASVNATDCHGENFSAAGTKGTVTLSPNQTTLYRITCTNTATAGSVQDTALVNVTYVNEDHGGPDTSPPVITDGAPTGTLSATTTSVTLKVATDEKALCKYSLFSGTGFDQMTKFSSTNAMTHSATVNNLSSNAHYRYYVRCEDEEKNRNNADYAIEFNIGTPQ